MTRATARQRVLKALAAVGCRGSRNDHDITHAALDAWDEREAFCRAIAGDQFSRLHDKLFSRCDHSGCSAVGCYSLRNTHGSPIQTIGDLVEAVRAAYPR